MLTNPRAERVKSVRALGRRSARRRADRFVAEGPQSVREALTHRSDTVIDLYAEETQSHRHADLITRARERAVPVRSCSREVLDAMSDTRHPQGVIAVCRPVDVALDEALGAPGRFAVVLAHVRDPGNAGTVLRGADAAGARCVIVSDASVDVYNPKVVRSTAGSLWHLPVVTGVPVTDALDACRGAGLRLLAADGSGETLLPDADLASPHAWVMGNEAWGLDAAIRGRCDDVVRVPIHGRAESLNLAMAATVCVYASAGSLLSAAPDTAGLAD